MTILLCTFFGLKGFLIIGLAVIIALITGLIFQFIHHQQWLDAKESENLKLDLTEFSILSDIAHRFRHFKYTKTNLAKTGQSILKGSINNANSVLWWFAIAWAMASFIGFYIPKSIFTTYLSSSTTGLFNTLGMASIIEVCSEGSSILALELYKHTQSIGNVFVFLLAGVATDYTEIGLLWTTIGKRTAILLPIISVPLIIITGFLLNQL